MKVAAIDSQFAQWRGTALEGIGNLESESKELRSLLSQKADSDKLGSLYKTVQALSASSQDKGDAVKNFQQGLQHLEALLEEKVAAVDSQFAQCRGTALEGIGNLESESKELRSLLSQKADSDKLGSLYKTVQALSASSQDKGDAVKNFQQGLQHLEALLEEKVAAVDSQFAQSRGTALEGIGNLESESKELRSLLSQKADSDKLGSLYKTVQALSASSQHKGDAVKNFQQGLQHLEALLEEKVAAVDSQFAQCRGTALEGISNLESESKELRSLLSQKADSDKLGSLYKTVQALSASSQDKGDAVKNFQQQLQHLEALLEEKVAAVDSQFAQCRGTALEGISNLESESKELRSLLSQKADSDKLGSLYKTVQALSASSQDKGDAVKNFQQGLQHLEALLEEKVAAVDSQFAQCRGTALEGISNLESESKELRSLLSQKADSDKLGSLYKTVQALSASSQDKGDAVKNFQQGLQHLEALLEEKVAAIDSQFAQCHGIADAVKNFQQKLQHVETLLEAKATKIDVRSAQYNGMASVIQEPERRNNDKDVNGLDRGSAEATVTTFRKAATKALSKGVVVHRSIRSRRRLARQRHRAKLQCQQLPDDGPSKEA